MRIISNVPRKRIIKTKRRIKALRKMLKTKIATRNGKLFERFVVLPDDAVCSVLGVRAVSLYLFV